MGSCKLIIAAVIFPYLTMYPQSADTLFVSPAVRDMIGVFKGATARQVEIVRERGLGKILYDSSVAIINRIKENKEIDLWDRFALKKALTNAENQAERITALDDEADTLFLRMNFILDSLVIRMRHEIAGERNVADQRRTLAKVRIKAAYDLQRIPTSGIQAGRVRFLITEDAESLNQKADYMLDQQDKLESHAGKISQIIEDLEWNAGFFQPEAHNELKQSLRLPITGIEIREEDRMAGVIRKLHEERSATLAQALRCQAIVNEIHRIAGNQQKLTGE